MIIDPEVVLVILAFAGIGVVGLTEMLKRLFGLKDFWVYVLSLIVSGLATAFTLVQMSAFTVLAFAVYTIVVFLEANGIYKAVKKPSPA